jgi:hypothetical protein
MALDSNLLVAERLARPPREEANVARTRLALMVLVVLAACGDGTGPGVRTWAIGVWDYRSVVDYHPTCSCFTPFHIEQTGTITVMGATDSSSQTDAFFADSLWTYPTNGQVRTVSSQSTFTDSWSGGVFGLEKLHSLMDPSDSLTVVAIGNPTWGEGYHAEWTTIEGAPRVLYDSLDQGTFATGGYCNNLPNCYAVVELRKRAR